MSTSNSCRAESLIRDLFELMRNSSVWKEQAVSDFVAAQGEQQPALKSDVMAKMAAQAEVSRRSEFASSGGEKTGRSGKIWITFAVLVLLTAGVAAGIRYRKMKNEAAQA